MKLLIHTQVYENYGAHAWSGEGACPQYWKAKGGDDYEVATLTPVAAADHVFVGELIDRAAAKVARNDQYFREEYIGYSLLRDDELTDFEQQQKDFEGRIIFPRRQLPV